MKPSIYDSLSQDTVAAAEALHVMMQKEQSSVYASRDYLNPPVADPTTIIESDRLKIVDWCYGVADHCKFDRETVALAMDLVDRFLSTSGEAAQKALRDRRQFQLLAMAALYLSIKTNEKVAVGSHFFATMSRGVYSVKDILPLTSASYIKKTEAMELEVLKGLEWRICAPTSVQMAYKILSLVHPHVNLQESVWGYLLDEIRFQTEYSLRDYSLSMSRQSTVAMAAIFNSLDQIGQEDRQAILQALLSVVNEEFDSPRVLLAARNRLLSLIEGSGASDVDSIVSESSKEVEACFLNREYSDECMSDASVASVRASPRSVACCSRS